MIDIRGFIDQAGPSSLYKNGQDQNHLDHSYKEWWGRYEFNIRMVKIFTNFYHSYVLFMSSVYHLKVERDSEEYFLLNVNYMSHEFLYRLSSRIISGYLMIENQSQTSGNDQLSG